MLVLFGESKPNLLSIGTGCPCLHCRGDGGDGEMVSISTVITHERDERAAVSRPVYADVLQQEGGSDEGEVINSQAHTFALSRFLAPVYSFWPSVHYLSNHACCSAAG